MTDQDQRPASSGDVDAVISDLKDVVRSLDKVTGYGKRTRMITWVMAASLALDLVLTITVSVLALNAVHRNGDLHNAQITACQIGNDGREKQQLLWRTLINEFDKHQTKQQEQHNRHFLSFIDTTFKPVNCVRIYGRK